MTIAPTVQKYLDRTVTYEMIPHERTQTSMRTAQACHISGRRLAKGVILRRGRDYLLAVIPASRHVRIDELRQQFGDDIDFADEQEIAALFPDCDRGAIPPFGECYALDMAVDESIDQQSDVYMEGGDHMTLVHLDHDQFQRLVGNAWHGRFSS
jgi:Ala-tRNA(Pro) deacylase